MYVRVGRISAALAALATLAVVLPAAAHNLRVPAEEPVSAETAFGIEDTELSQVINFTIDADAQQRWLSFDGQAGNEFFAQLGVPVLDRLDDYRPELYLVGPGLPDTNTPFDRPNDLGAMPLSTIDSERRFFEEKFTGVEDWILVETTTALSEDGRYYLVGHSPEPEGKFWIAWGTEERFDLQAIANFERALELNRAFHEVDDERLPIRPRILRTISRIVRWVFNVVPTI